MRKTAMFFLMIMISFSLSCAKHTNSDSLTPFNRLVDQLFDFYFQQHPTDATANGFHQHDKELEDYSAAGREKEISGLQEFLGKFQSFNRSGLSADNSADLDVVISSIQSRLLDLQDIQSWRKDPDTYTSGVTNSIFLIMKRDFAPADDRLRSVIAREQQIPQAFEAARQNLQNPPKIYVQIALEQLPDVTDFFRKDVPDAFASVKDPQALAEFKSSNQGVIAALESYQKYLHDTVLPKANGDFRLGAENYRKKLLYDEMVDIPLDRLLELGYADLHRNQEEMKKVAAQIDKKRTVQQVLAELQDNHPAPDQLLEAFRDSFAGLRQFIEQKKIITIPAGTPPVLEDTPPFMRATTTASIALLAPMKPKTEKRSSM